MNLILWQCILIAEWSSRSKSLICRYLSLQLSPLWIEKPISSFQIPKALFKKWWWWRNVEFKFFKRREKKLFNAIGTKLFLCQQKSYFCLLNSHDDYDFCQSWIIHWAALNKSVNSILLRQIPKSFLPDIVFGDTVPASFWKSWLQIGLLPRSCCPKVYVFKGTTTQNFVRYNEKRFLAWNWNCFEFLLISLFITFCL